MPKKRRKTRIWKGTLALSTLRVRKISTILSKIIKNFETIRENASSIITSARREMKQHAKVICIVDGSASCDLTLYRSQIDLRFFF